jgi:hypothetical protein
MNAAIANLDVTRNYLLLDGKKKKVEVDNY